MAGDAPSQPPEVIEASDPASRPTATRRRDLALRPSRASLRADRSDYLIALAVASAISSVFALAEPALRCPMVIPLVVSAGLGGADAIRAVRRNLDLLDPQALFGFFAWHFFFLAPLLHVSLHYYISYVPTPSDFRPWLEQMAWWNAGGLLVFRLVLYGWDRFVPMNPVRRRWTRSGGKFLPVLASFIVISAVFELYVLIATGPGIVEDPLQTAKRFQGVGWVIAVSNSLPLLVLLAVVFMLRDRGRQASALLTGCILGGFAIAQFAVAGLRGSRASFVFGVVIAAAAVHFVLRPLSGRFLLTSILVGILFMYLYGFYKSYGTEGLSAITSSKKQATLQRRSGRSLELLVLEDLGRSDVQALLLERLDGPAKATYRFRLGETYLADMASVIPHAIIARRPVDKRTPGTYLLYGRDVAASGYLAQHIYGLAGEWTLNFDPITIPFAFALFGCAAAVAFRYCRTLPAGDSRSALIGLVGILVILGMSSDLDNVLSAGVTFGLVPCVALFFGSTRCSIAEI